MTQRDALVALVAAQRWLPSAVERSACAEPIAGVTAVQRSAVLVTFHR